MAASPTSESTEWADWTFFISITISFGANLQAALISTLTQIFGPGLALRGGEAGSISKAINSMFSLKLVAIRFFEIGIFALLCAFLTWAWKWLDYPIAITVTIGNCLTVGIIIYYMKTIPETFAIPKEFVATGEILIGDNSTPANGPKDQLPVRKAVEIV